MLHILVTRGLWQGKTSVALAFIVYDLRNGGSGFHTKATVRAIGKTALSGNFSERKSLWYRIVPDFLIDYYSAVRINV